MFLVNHFFPSFNRTQGYFSPSLELMITPFVLSEVLSALFFLLQLNQQLEHNIRKMREKKYVLFLIQKGIELFNGFQ